MMCGFLTRVSVMIFGYAYPAYECYKTVELNKPEIEQLLFWCQYWILVAVLAVFERVGDALISWLPLYGEVKLAFFIYLWHPKTKGTTYIYSNFFQPYMSKHESKIDRKLLELRTRAADLAARYWQKALRNGGSWFFESLQHIASQPSTVVHPVEEPAHARHSSAAPPNKTEQTSTSPQLKAEEPNLAVNQKPEHVKAENSPPPPSSPTPKHGHGGHSRSSGTSASHHPSPHNEMPAQQNLTAANNPSSSPHPEDPKQEEPVRMVRRPRTKKRVTTTASSIP